MPASTFKINQQMIGRRRLAPTDPPPDLAVEVDVTSKTTLAAYEAIGVPELWVYGNSRLTIYLLQTGKYVESSYSLTFPDLPLTELIPTTVEPAWQVGTVQALEEFETQFASNFRDISQP